ncbi:MULTISPECIES: LysM peptidoglycan-binding domain-containing protein [Microbacterium]|uniref:LysM domain-containing protein n=1 Tax=Microbacterium wangchenii TaxID=2541726 RepID=A0ABX5STE7_9MICO|nr:MULTISPECIES: LysM domain-containing protein [Microbacterium]MCK6064974.1 LysM peptidoglycan-binding domain-containing protein [Microbacterium sp. EYE_512]QBR88447.1 LysM domain-containing protein [Microbacterium wangchenii]
MRPSGRTPRARSLVSGLPLALAGSIALALTAESAHAAPAPADHTDAVPERRDAAGGKVVAHRAALALAAPADHVVVAGGTVSTIAARYGLRTPDVLAANGLDWSSVIYPGQVLRLAAPAPAAAAAPAPSPVAVLHTVQAGDTVSAIARGNGVSTQAVLDANGLTRESIIYPGQTLAIPAPVLSAAPAAAASPAPAADGLDAEQIANAQLIIAIGRELGVSERGIAIALGTAMQESWLRNLDWGDRDSLGLFQQRPSTGWGTAEEIRDPARSTRAFFGGAADPNGTLTRGLLDIPGWEGMSYTDAAQAVQISAFPERYAQWEQPAYAWLAALG